MITKQAIRDIICKTLVEIIPDKNFIMDDDFISFNSRLESIEIAQLITRIEELLQENGIEDYDLFERVFENEKLTFNSLVELIFSDLKI